VPAVPSCILDPLWDQFAALLPTRQVRHPLGCHRQRIPDRSIFGKLIQILVFGCGYRRIADETCSATTLRRRRDEWIALGVAEQVHRLALVAYDRMHGLEVVAIDDALRSTSIHRAAGAGLAALAVPAPQPARQQDPARPLGGGRRRGRSAVLRPGDRLLEGPDQPPVVADPARP
jgi:transposase